MDGNYTTFINNEKGPWGHLLPFAKPNSKGAGDYDFGEAAKVCIHDEQLRWFNYWLKGQENGILEGFQYEVQFF